MFVPQFLICKIETKRNPFIRSVRIKQATFAKCLMFVNVLLKLNVLCIPEISALGRLRQEICKFEASLGYVVRPQNKTLKNCSARGPGTSPLVHFRNTYIAH